jgi:hypothetical protein
VNEKRKDQLEFNLGTSTGINNSTGILGIHGEFLINNKVSITVGAGLSSWGGKLCLNGKYFLKPDHKGWAFGGGLTQASGSSSMDIEEKLKSGNSISHTFKLNPIVGLDLIAARYWRLGERRNRIYLQLGYNRALTTNQYKLLSPTQPNPDFYKVMDLLSPRGIVVALGFSFKL